MQEEGKGTREREGGKEEVFNVAKGGYMSDSVRE